MKKTLSLVLALLMVIAVVPAFGLGVFAEEDATVTPTTTYAVYTQDFESVDPDSTMDEVLQALGWYIPASKTDDDIADYSIVVNGEGADANHALRVSTIAPVGLTSESFVTIYNGDAMSLLRAGNFTLSYQLTYRSGSSNTDGYTSVIYNYNEGDGSAVGVDEAVATYGIVALRVCGTGFNSVYYPVSSGSTMAMLEGLPNQAEVCLGNRFSTTGQYPSLYARLFMENPAEEAADTTLSGNDLFVDETLNIRIEYSFLDGVYVYVNDILVSQPMDTSYSKYANVSTWNDFLTRTTGSSVALLTKENIVAEIDNILITAERIGTTEEEQPIPELVITEIAPSGDGTNTWNEYIEIYNTTDHVIDLCDYSICYADTVFDGDANDPISDGSRMTKITSYVKFDSLLGKSLTSGTNFYCTAEYLSSISSSRYIFVDANTDLTKGTRYRKNGSTYETAADGNLIKIKYVETWNQRYNPANSYDENGNLNTTSFYSSNTLINPGACVLIYTILDSTENCWKYGVNAGLNDRTTISTDTSFRQSYKSRGLGTDTTVKVIAERAFNLADSECRRYYIAKAYDDNGQEINYTKRYATDLTDIISYADYVSPLVAGKLAGGTDVTDLTTLGNAAIQEVGYSGVYVYGVDASTDYRAGTLYMGRHKVSSSNHVGLLAGYQQILFDCMTKKDASVLSITEIAPRTLNLKGEDKNAFSAMEITNTSSQTLNLYNYTIVRNELGATCNYGKTFTRMVELRSGNPVNKGVSNGAYYYFVDEHISNPDTCLLAPGETVVLWFLTEDTYTSYANDDDFGTDYFRQYWVNMGNVQMAAKNADGEYATKVIAVDGNVTATYNRDNANSVLDLSYTSSAVYGIAKATPAVLNYSISTNDVVSVAYLGQISVYFNLHEEEQQLNGTTYVYQVLDYQNIPANGSMHYVVGRTGTGICSGMARSLKVQYWNYNTSRPLNYNKANGAVEFRLHFVTNYGMQTPDIGMVRGNEVFALENIIFYPVTDGEGNITYYYYDALHTSVKTLQGAALNMTGTTAKLRFDNVVPVSVYNSLAATYGGENLKVGMLVVESSKLTTETFTKASLANSNISYQDVTGKVLYRTSDYAVLGSYVAVDASRYHTDYTAIGYLEVTLEDGTVQTFWSGVTATASVAKVAQKALNDFSWTQDDIYKYAMASGAYSRYTAEELTTLRQFGA